MKKTIEEVANEYLMNTNINEDTAIRDAFKAGAKHQSEQMYSEQDIIQAFNEGQALNVRGKLIQGKDWFRIFKEK